jgi:uncharacterized protein (TIGR03437 family)
MATDNAGAIYIAGTLGVLGFGSPISNRVPPGGINSLLPENQIASFYIARVRPEGDVVFWVTAVPMSVQDLEIDAHGNLWASGIADRAQGSGAVGPCVSTDNPTVAQGIFGARAPAVLKLSPDGKTALRFQCVGSGFESTGDYRGPNLTALLRFDASGNLYLTGSAGGNFGLATTPGAPISTPGNTGVNPYPGTFTPYAIKLDPDAASVLYATWLPGDHVNAAAVDSGGVLTFAGAVSEINSLPAAGFAQPTAAAGSIVRTSDGGLTWQNGSNGLPGPPEHVALARGSPGALLAWNEQWIYMSTDGSRSWQKVPLPAGASATPWNRQMFWDDSGQTIFLLQYDYYTAPLFARYQKGQWTTLKLPAPPIFSSASFIAGGAGSTVYFFQSGIWYSTDAGNTWQQGAAANSTWPAQLLAHPADGRIIYGVTQSNPYTVAGTAVYQQTTDYGRTWTSANVPGPTVSLSPKDPMLLVSSIFDFSGGAVYRSRDGGQQWETYTNVNCNGAQPNPADSGSVICFNPSSPTQAATKLDLASKQLSAYQPALGGSGISAVLWPASSSSQFYLLRAPRNDGFVCQLNSAGTQFNFCTYLGGAGEDAVTALAATRNGGFWIAGNTTSRNFPVSGNALQKSIRFGTDSSTAPYAVSETSDTFLCRLTGDGKQFPACTFFGGSFNEWALAIFEDDQGRPTLVGNTDSKDFPNTSDGLPFGSPVSNQDSSLHNSGFLMRADAALSRSLSASVFTRLPLGAARAPSPGLLAYGGVDVSSPPADYLRLPYIVNISSSVGVLDTGGVSSAEIQPYGFREPVFNAGLSLTPGGVGVITGSELTDASGSSRVLFDGDAAPALKTSASQINFQTPWSAAPGVHAIQVTYGGVSTAPIPIWLFPAVPVTFYDPVTLYPIANNQDGSLHGPDNPAAPGSTLRVFFSGAGNVANPPPAGQTVTAQAPAVLPLTVLLGPYQADVVYAGAAVGLVGASEVQLQIPNVPASEYSLWLVMDGIKSNRTLISIGGAQ